MVILVVMKMMKVGMMAMIDDDDGDGGDDDDDDDDDECVGVLNVRGLFANIRGPHHRQLAPTRCEKSGSNTLYGPSRW